MSSLETAFRQHPPQPLVPGEVSDGPRRLVQRHALLGTTRRHATELGKQLGAAVVAAGEGGPAFTHRP